MSLHDNLTADILNAEQAVSDAEESLTRAKDRLANCEKALLDAILSEELPRSFEAHGRTWSYQPQTFVSPAEGKQDEVIAWIKEHGGADLVKPAMHWQSRDKFLRDILLTDEGEAQIPPELEGIVRVFEQEKVTKRRK